MFKLVVLVLVLVRFILLKICLIKFNCLIALLFFFKYFKVVLMFMLLMVIGIYIIISLLIWGINF